MNKFGKIAIVTALIVALGAVIAIKNRGDRTDTPGSSPPAVQQAESPPETQPASPQEDTAAIQALPRLVEFGGKKCMQCRRMVPVLNELTETYAGQIEVEVVDVFEEQSVTQEHRIRVIPTQVFFDASGEEVFRHEGFFSLEQIVAAWGECGVDLSAAPQSKEKG